jgi:integrase
VWQRASFFLGLQFRWQHGRLLAGRRSHEATASAAVLARIFFLIFIRRRFAFRARRASARPLQRSAAARAADRRAIETRHGGERRVLGKKISVLPCNGFLFSTKKGTPMHQNYIRKEFHTRCQTVGITKSVTVHDLRRYFCTSLIIEKEPIPVVQKLMGHRDVMTTLKIYALTTTKDEMKSANRHYLNRKYRNPQEIYTEIIDNIMEYQRQYQDKVEIVFEETSNSETIFRMRLRSP